jgi:hypothetical protein
MLAKSDRFKFVRFVEKKFQNFSNLEIKCRKTNEDFYSL